MARNVTQRSIRLHRFALSGHCHLNEGPAHAPEGGVRLAEYAHLRAWLERVESTPRFVGLPRSPLPEA
jgi:hypothetical protein